MPHVLQAEGVLQAVQPLAPPATVWVAPDLPTEWAANKEISRAVFALWHMAHAIGSSASRIERKVSNVVWQSLQLYSYSGMF